MYFYIPATVEILYLECFSIVFVKKTISDTEFEYRAYIEGSDNYIATNKDLNVCKQKVYEYLEYFANDLLKFIKKMDAVK